MGEVVWYLLLSPISFYLSPLSISSSRFSTSSWPLSGSARELRKSYSRLTQAVMRCSCCSFRDVAGEVRRVDWNIDFLQMAFFGGAEMGMCIGMGMRAWTRGKLWVWGFFGCLFVFLGCMGMRWVWCVVRWIAGAGEVVWGWLESRDGILHLP